MKNTPDSSHKTLCIGAGPAGLTAAYELARHGKQVVVLEAHPELVGGIARTIEKNGFRFDIGGHRFFSKSQEIESLWSELLPHDFLIRPRSSQIFYRGKFFPYPLKAMQTLRNLGLWETCLCLFSYFKSAVSPFRNPANFKQWMTNRFGSRLFEIFFKTYTEKVWGRTCDDLSTEWAEQRVQNFSLSEALLSALIPSSWRRSTPKTLLNTFRYPRLGPGMLWEETARKIKNLGGDIQLDAKVTSITQIGHLWEVQFTQGDETKTDIFGHVISSMPLKKLEQILTPRLPQTIAMNDLEYRDFILVALMTESADTFNDQWLYIHDKNVKACRLQNFKAWSPEMVPGPEYNCYGLEYFCSEGDALWRLSDEELIALAKKESSHLSLFPPESVIDAHVVRQKKAYPVYSGDYKQTMEAFQNEMTKNYPGLFVAGRNGMHRYNNQDHAMMTGLLAARNIMASQNIYNPWLVNQDAEYLEDKIETLKLNVEQKGFLTEAPALWSSGNIQ